MNGGGDYGTQSHIAEPYSCLQVWVNIRSNSKIPNGMLLVVPAYDKDYPDDNTSR